MGKNKGKNGRKKKSKRLGNGKNKHNKGKNKINNGNGDAGAETIFGTTGSRDIVVGVAVAAILLALGFVVVLAYRAKKVAAKQQEIAFNEKADSEWIGSSHS